MSRAPGPGGRCIRTDSPDEWRTRGPWVADGPGGPRGSMTAAGDHPKRIASALTPGAFRVGKRRCPRWRANRLGVSCARRRGCATGAPRRPLSGPAAWERAIARRRTAGGGSRVHGGFCLMTSAWVACTRARTRLRRVGWPIGTCDPQGASPSVGLQERGRWGLAQAWAWA